MISPMVPTFKLPSILCLSFRMKYTPKGRETSCSVMYPASTVHRPVCYVYFCNSSTTDCAVIDKNAPIKDAQDRFRRWNVTLEKKIRSFVAEKSTLKDPITAIYFSSYKVFTDILNHPKKHGFPQKDIQKSRGSIWMDHLHPTSAVHLFVAKELGSLLSTIPPLEALVETEDTVVQGLSTTSPEY